MGTKCDRNIGLNDATPQDWDRANAMSRQVGGEHYKGFKIQPIEFAMANELTYCEANIVKYACRHHAKGGVQDVDKIIHYAELLKELVYGQK
jgi:hypothetical protein